MDVGKSIKSLREKSNLSLRELGSRVGINYSFLSQVEHGKKRPNLEHLEKLADYFEVHVSYFFGGEVISTPEELKGLVDWISLSKELKGKGLSPEQVKQIVEFAQKMKGV
jgi:transcriptional regulator with XRE-family HTH domain